MTKSLAYISIYLGFFGWLFGSDKKEKQDQTSSVQDNSSMTEESLEETSPVEEAQVEVPELFPNGLPLKNAKIPPEVGHPSAQNCGTCHTSIYSQWKNDGHGKNETYHTLREYIYQKEGLPFKDSPLCQNCHLPVEDQHSKLFSEFTEQDPQRPQYIENNQWNPLLYTEGVNCISCHARDEQIISIPRPPVKSIKNTSKILDTGEDTSSPIDTAKESVQNTTEIKTTGQSNPDPSTVQSPTPTPPTNTPIKITVSPTSFTHTSSQIHSALPSSELAQSKVCATCHQSNESIGAIYNTFVEWQNSVYADQNVGCVSCHYDEMAVLDGSSSYSTLSSHGISKELWEGLSLDYSIDTPIIQRGETTPIKIALINTGSGHSIPTNPWRKYTFVAEIVDAKEKVIWKSSELILGSNVKIVENPLIIEKSIEEVTADSNIKDSNTKDETTSQATITPQPTETSNAEKTLVEETSVAEEPNSTDIILPTHILSSDSGISILPFQRHIWSEEVEISVKKSPGIVTLIISEKNTGHVFIRSTLEVR